MKLTSSLEPALLALLADVSARRHTYDLMTAARLPSRTLARLESERLVNPEREAWQDNDSGRHARPDR